MATISQNAFRVAGRAFAGTVAAAAVLLCSALPAWAATISISAPNKPVTAGAAFSVTVNVSTPTAPMNAASGTVKVSGDVVEITGVSKANSIFNFWTVEPSFTKTSSAFEGVAFDPGFTGASGRIMTVTMRATKPGTAVLSIAGASVLKNDGLGTEILTGVGSATVTVAAAVPATEKPATPVVKPVPVTPAPAPTPAPVTPTPVTKPAETTPTPAEDIQVPLIPSEPVVQHNVRIDEPAVASQPFTLPFLGIGFSDVALYVIFFLLILCAVFAYEVVRLTNVTGTSVAEREHVMHAVRKVLHRHMDVLHDDVLDKGGRNGSMLAKLVDAADAKMQRDIDTLLK